MIPMNKLTLSLSLLFAISLSQISAQSYNLAWKDSLDCRIIGYGDKFPLLLMDEPNDAIYVAAHQHTGATETFLWRYDLAGNQIWERKVNHGVLHQLQLDPAGNIYALVNNRLIKFKPDGEKAWTQSFFLDDFSVGIRDFIIINEAEIYLVGQRGQDISPTQYITNGHLIKLNGDGEILWRKNYEASDFWKVSTTLDQLNILVDNAQKYGVLNTSFDGDSLGLKEFFLTEFIPQAKYVYTDSKGSFFSGAWFDAYHVSKISFEGEVQWTYQREATLDWRPLRAHYTKADRNQNVYVVGETINIADNDTYLLITKLDPNGSLLWEKRLNNFADHQLETINNFYIKDNYLVMTGQIYDQDGKIEAYVIKMSDEGEVLSELGLGPNPDRGTFGIAVEEDSLGNVYLIAAGSKNGNNDFLDLYKFEKRLSNSLANNFSSENLLEVSPNPFTDQLRLSGAFDQLWIYDVLGQQVQSSHSASPNLSLDLSELEPGIYFLSVRKGEAISSQKIIKQ